MVSWFEKRTNVGGVICCTEDQLRSTIISRADVADVGLASNKDLGTSKITELEDTRHWIEQKVLRFDITMAYAQRMNVGKRAEKLVHV